MKILLMGPPASGKGTIGKLLSEKFRVPLISVGKLLRDMPDDHPHYKSIHRAMGVGELAPHKETVDIIKERIRNRDCDSGYILDGWMRNIDQMNFFDPDIDNVLFIYVSPETSIKRITGRRVCENDGFVCNIYTQSPGDEGYCGKCSGELIQREDDAEEVVIRRLEIFEKETMEVVNYYRDKNLLLEINGEGSPEEVFQLALTALDE